MMARRAPEETRFFIGQAAPGVGHLVQLWAGDNFSGVLHLSELRDPFWWVGSTGRHEVHFNAVGRFVQWA